MIRINKVKITNWGPLKEFCQEIKPFSLIYGRNETGKTTFIEAVVSALFRKNKEFFIRNDEDFIGKSEVWVSGIKDNEVIFKNTSKPKLDDFFPQEVNLLSLICVRASDLRFAYRFLDLFSQFMFPAQQLVKLQKNIPEYVKIKDYQLIFEKNMGIKKEIEDYDSQLDEINKVLSEIKDIAFYELKEMKDKKVLLEAELEKIRQAKAGYLYNLKKEYEDKKAKIEKIDLLLRNLKGRFIELSNRKKVLEDEAEELSKNISDIEYLRSVYESLNSFMKTTKLKGPFLMILASLVSGAILLFTRNFSFYLQLIIFLLGAFILLKIYRKYSKDIYTDQRIKVLSHEYKNRYGKDIPSAEQILSQIREKETDKRIYESKKDEIKKCELEINKIYSNIIEESKIDSSLDMVSIFKKLEEERNNLKNEIELLQDKMMNLGEIKPEPLWEKESVLYDLDREKALIKELDSLSKKITEKEDKLSCLKIKISSLLHLKEEKDIVELARLLEEKEKELSANLKELYLTALSYGVINDVIEKIDKKRKAIIQEQLSSQEFSSFLKTFSNERYQRAFMEEDVLFVEAEDKSKIPFDYLSSGAQEQVLLAIRAGLCLKSSGSEMFFLLDDPLLHTDWQRRPQAVKTLMKLVSEKKWQVIYLTSDDYTRQLICTEGKSLGEEFCLIELEKTAL